MNEIALPVQSTSSLMKATISATILAVILLTTVILPAEYNIDTTGVGNALGLTQLSATPSVSSPIPSSDTNSGPAFRNDSVSIEVPAGDGIEYKFNLKQYGTLRYDWTSKNGEIYFDFHGEPQGDTSGYFESYTVSTASDARGSLTTPFDGSHGWYWRNDSSKPMTITLKTQGSYEIIGIK